MRSRFVEQVNISRFGRCVFSPQFHQNDCIDAAYAVFCCAWSTLMLIYLCKCATLCCAMGFGTHTSATLKYDMTPTKTFWRLLPERHFGNIEVNKRSKCHVSRSQASSSYDDDTAITSMTNISEQIKTIACRHSPLHSYDTSKLSNPHQKMPTKAEPCAKIFLCGKIPSNKQSAYGIFVGKSTKIWSMSSIDISVTNFQRVEML